MPPANVRNGMCLSTASGAIGKDGRIVSVQHAVQQGLGSGLVYIALCSGFVEDAVESEGLVLHSFALGYKVSRELLDGVVLRRIEDARRVSAFMRSSVRRMLRTGTSRPQP
jgi:hypothetical protein